MPLAQQTRQQVIDYCEKHIEPEQSVLGSYWYIADLLLRDEVVREHLAARYMYKLGQAIHTTDARLRSHYKFQIVQYASIYEAIVDYLLWRIFSDHPAVTRIAIQMEMRPAASWPSNLSVLATDDHNKAVHLAKWVAKPLPSSQIRFARKLDASVEIGFVSKDLSKDLQKLYDLRNGVHITNAVSRGVRYDLEMARLAYRRIDPFNRAISRFLQAYSSPLRVQP